MNKDGQSTLTRLYIIDLDTLARELTNELISQFLHNNIVSSILYDDILYDHVQEQNKYVNDIWDNVDRDGDALLRFLG